MSGKKNRQFILAEVPKGKLGQDHFRLQGSDVPRPAEGEVLVKVRYISIDPATRDVLRIKQLALNTEKTYLLWLRHFQAFLGGKPPGDLNFDDMRRYLSYLAVERKVAAATQNQALNAILFLYRHVLNIDSGEAIVAVRAERRRRLNNAHSESAISSLKMLRHKQGQNHQAAGSHSHPHHDAIRER